MGKPEKPIDKPKKLLILGFPLNFKNWTLHKKPISFLGFHEFW
jgi:hypothetical protein